MNADPRKELLETADWLDGMAVAFRQTTIMPKTLATDVIRRNAFKLEGRAKLLRLIAQAGESGSPPRAVEAANEGGKNASEPADPT